MTYKNTKYTCWFTYLAISSIFALPPMLFVTFRDMYSISYTLLGTLVLINFLVQMSIDLVFTFFSKYFNIKLSVATMPLLTSAGLLIFALVPWLFPQYAYPGLITGTIIFSVSAGLSEVLLSPIVAALPSDNPERDMSMLHSLYAYGVLTVVVISSVFFMVFGRENWMYLALFFAVLPVIPFIFYCLVPIPEINVSNGQKNKKTENKKALLLFLMCIFFGSCAEVAMTNWISGYMEIALGMSKNACDILGLAMFAILLGIGRSFYAKYGKNIMSVLLFGMTGSFLSYIVAGLSSNVTVAAVACAFTGFCTSMLWPGTLIMMEEELPGCGVTAYALMAAGGDFGASVAPQLLGIIVDKVSASDFAVKIASVSTLSTEQIGMKTGMLTASIFPFLGVLILTYIKKYVIKKA